MSGDQSPAQIRQNTIEKVTQLRAQLVEIDQNEGEKARELLNLYSALHADPSGDNAKDDQGRTAAEVYAEYEKVSAETAKQKEPLEAQLNEFNKGLGLVADYQTLRAAAKERAEASAAACQEPPKDLTAFSNPELDRIRSQLQTNPLPGGEKSSIDDGTGGGSSTTTTTTSQATAAAAAKQQG